MSEFENEQIPAETAPAVQAEAVPEPAAVEQVSEPAPKPEAAPAVEAAAEPAPAAEVAAEPAPAAESAVEPAPAAETAAAPAESAPRQNQGRPAGEARPPRKQGEGKPRGDRPPRPEGKNDKAADRPDRGDRPKGGERRDDRNRGRDGRPGGRDHGRPMGRPDLPVEIDIEKLMADSLYLDNQAHAVVSRIREMDAGTRSQVRRLFSAVRRACRAAESDRQHQFVMLRARLAYTIARHQLRSLDPLERLLLQVTRKNDPRAYERFRDLFEAIVAYNE